MKEEIEGLKMYNNFMYNRMLKLLVSYYKYVNFKTYKIMFTSTYIYIEKINFSEQYLTITRS